MPSEIAADTLTHISYAFAVVKDGRIVQAENFTLLSDLRRQPAPADPDLRRRLDVVQQLF